MVARVAARWQLIVAAILFSTGGTAVTAGTRSALAALTFALLFPLARRGWTWRVWPVAAAYTATMISYVVANQWTTAANVTFLGNTAPLYVLALGVWLLREPIRRRDGWTMGLLALGVGAFFLDAAPVLPTAADPARGNLLAALHGAIWGVTLVGLRWLNRETPETNGAAATGVGVRALVAGNLLTALVCLPIAAASGALPTVTSGDVIALGWLGLFQITSAYVLLTRSLRVLPALEASFLLLLEPVAAPIWAFVFHGERPGPFAFAGGACIVAATVLPAWLAARRPRPPLGTEQRS